MQNEVNINLSLSQADDKEGESTNSLKLLLDFVLKLNSAFVTAKELQEVLNAVLAGTTAGEGLGFNRAFLFLVNKERGMLQGHCALGPQSLEDAVFIWDKISKDGMTLFDILKGVKEQLTDKNHPLNLLVKNIKIPLSDAENCLVLSLKSNQALLVTDSPRVGAFQSKELCELFGTGEFAVAPLYTHGEEYGVVVADNLFTKTPITKDKLYSLHLFTGIASLAISQSEVCRELAHKVERLKQVNRAVENQKNLLIETEKYSAIGRMLESLFHELRNPVTSIGGIVRLLQKKERDEKKRRYLDSVIKEVEKVEDTLNKVAELHNIGPLNRNQFNLISLLDMTIALIQAELEEVGIVLHRNYPKDSVHIVGDREKLQEAILCIVKNSIEAMPDGGIMVITVSKRGANVELRISDSGLGIARGHFKKVQNPFFTTKFNALGLGLSKAKKIVELHHGLLSLTSNRIGGTTCIISLPRVINS